MKKTVLNTLLQNKGIDFLNIFGLAIPQKATRGLLIFLSQTTKQFFSKESKYHSQPSPDSLYGLSKYVGEKIVEFNFRKFDASLIIRYPIVIGKLKKSNDVISYMYREAKKNHVIELFGEGDGLLSVIVDWKIFNHKHINRCPNPYSLYWDGDYVDKAEYKFMSGLGQHLKKELYAETTPPEDDI